MFTFTSSAKSSPSLFAYSAPIPNKSSILAESQEIPSLTSEVQSLTPVDGILATTAAITPRRILINGTPYKLTFEEPNPGEYAIAERASTADDYQIRINPIARQPRYQVHLQSTPSTRIPTTEIDLDIPSFMETWNCLGAINFTRSLEGHPTANALFQLTRKEECSARLQLRRGKKVNLFGIPLRITNYSYTPVQDEVYQVKVSISFVGEHDSYANPSRNPLDLPIRLKGKDGDKSGWQSLSDYAKEHGVQYTGDKIYTYVPKTTSKEALITVRQLLDRAIVNQQFMYYSAPGRIKAFDWGKTKLHLFDVQWHKIISHTFAGAGAVQGKLQLAKEYRNTELVLQKPEDVGDDIQKITYRWEFKRAKSLTDVQTPAEPLSVGDEIYILKNPTTELLRDPGIAFDVGNFAKEAHYIGEQGGVEISRETWVYGWVFSSLDTYSVVPIKNFEISGDQNFGGSVAVSENYRVIFTPYKLFSFISSAWQQVRYAKTVRQFDKKGYLVSEATEGKELARSLQDSSSLEAIGTQLSAFQKLFESEQTEDPEQSAALLEEATALFAIADAYRFLKTEPVKKSVSYELQPHSKYFSDINNPTAEAEDYVEPRFMHHSISSELKRIIEENPGSTENIPLPPIIRGKEETQEQRVTITSKKDPGKFVVTDFTTNAEGNGLRQKITVADGGEQIGRPSIHQRKEIEEPPTPQNFTSGNSSFLLQSLDVEENKETKFLLNTPNSDPIDKLSQDSISFPDVYEKSLGLKAAETKISIENTKASEVLVLETLYQDWEEGDRVVFEGNQYVILGINYTIIVEGVNRLKCNDYRLTLGRLITPSVKVTEIKTNPNSALVDSPINGLQAIDGNVGYLNSVFNYLAEPTIANAIRLGLLEDFLKETGLLVLSPEEMSQVDALENFLQGGFGGAPNLDNSSGSPKIIANLPEDGTFTDNRIKTPIEKFADLLNRISLIDKFNSKLEEILGKLLLESESPALAAQQEGASTGGGGNPLESNIQFPSVSPNIVLEGGDEMLSKMLNALFGALDKLLLTLQKQKPGASGGGSGGAGGTGGTGAGGSGGGGSGGARQLPFFPIGDLLVFLTSTDINGLLALILEMIAEARRLIKNFELTPEELLENVLGALQQRQAQLAAAGGGGSGGAGGTGGDGAAAVSSGGSRTINLIFPEGLEPATITIVAPDEDLDSVDFESLFAELDLMLTELAALAQEDFGFELDLSLLEPQAGIAPPPSASGGSVPFGGTDFDAPPNLGSGITFFPGDDLVQTILAEVKDISGVIGGGVKPLPNKSLGVDFWETSVIPSNGGLLTGGAEPGSGLTNSLPSPTPPAISGSLSDSSGLSGNTSNNPTSETSGNTGEFNSDGSSAANLPTAPPFPDTNFAIAPVIPVASGFLLPSTSVTEILEDLTGQFILAPETLSHDPLTQGSLFIAEGTTASEIVFWEIISDSVGVDVLTPYDLEPTIEFANNFDGAPVTLRVSLFKAPSISAIVNILVSPVSILSVGKFYVNGSATVSDDTRVDTTTLAPVFVVTGDSSFVFSWSPPAFDAISSVKNYVIEEQQSDLSWSVIATTTEPQGNFELGATYRILSDYGNQLGGIPSEPFVLETAPVIGLSTLSVGKFYTNGDRVGVTPVPPDPFYTGILSEEAESSLTVGKFYTNGDRVGVTPVPPSPFYIEVSTEEAESSLVVGKFYTNGDRVGVTPVPPSPFYTT